MTAEVSPTESVIPNLGAIVLCGGASSRMGVDKAKLPFGDSTFLNCVVDRLQTVVSPIVLVTNPSQGVRQLDSTFKNMIKISDEFPDRGPLEGIRVGLQHLANQNVEFAFVTSCDVPLLMPEFIRYLFDRISSDDQAVVPLREPRNATDKRRVYGISAIYRTSIHPEISSLIASGRLRVSDIAETVRSQKIQLDEIRTFDSKLDSLMNVNSRQQYLELLERFNYDCDPEVLARLKYRDED